MQVLEKGDRGEDYIGAASRRDAVGQRRRRRQDDRKIRNKPGNFLMPARHQMYIVEKDIKRIAGGSIFGAARDEDQVGQRQSGQRRQLKRHVNETPWLFAGLDEALDQMVENNRLSDPRASRIIWLIEAVL